MRFSLTALLAIFVLGAIALAAIAPNLYFAARRAKQTEYAAVADLCSAAIERSGTHDRAAIAAALEGIRQRYAIESIAVMIPGQPMIHTGEAAGARFDHRETRKAASESIEIGFTDRSLAQLLRIGPVLAISGAIATVAGLIALVLAVMDSLRGSESIMDNAGSAGRGTGAGALIETFETSIRTMRGRESELKRLHSQEKERADALATITDTLVRSLTAGFISIDEQGFLLDMNQAGRDLLDVAIAPRALQTLREVLGPGELTDILQQAVDQRASLQRIEISQERRTIGLTTVPLLDQNDRYFGMLVLFTDLTPVRQLETRVREMQSLADLGELSAGIAHEFRNSLSTILGYLKLARKGTLSHETEERVRNAETEAHLLTSAVESLLSFARPMTLQMQPLDVHEMLADITARLQPLSSAIRIDLRGGPLPMEGDAALLGRAFENLVRNAIEAIEEKGEAGRIAIDVSTTARRVTIADDGVGIDESQATRLFLPFQSTKPNGFGLGLALTKKIILLHGGSIRLTGRRGEGTTATIEL